MHADFIEAERMLTSKGLTLAVMESCTGGLLAKSITDIPGCGDFFRGGIVSYATDVKILMGVDAATIEEFGVVSRETAASMAEAALLRLGSDIGIGITGVAGPDSQDGVSVGTVHIALASMDSPARVESHLFPNEPPDRVKESATLAAGRLLLASL